jgi:hypothetical protein
MKRVLFLLFVVNLFLFGCATIKENTKGEDSNEPEVNEEYVESSQCHLRKPDFNAEYKTKSDYNLIGKYYVTIINNEPVHKIYVTVYIKEYELIRETMSCEGKLISDYEKTFILQPLEKIIDKEVKPVMLFEGKEGVCGKVSFASEDIEDCS